jgi:uncharacterized protein (DUF486 family)
VVILASWGIALIEYCLAVPANRIGHQVYSAAELKTIQEVITLVVFAFFSVFYLGEKLTMNHMIGFALICAGAWFVFRGLSQGGLTAPLLRCKNRVNQRREGDPDA